MTYLDKLLNDKLLLAPCHLLVTPSFDVPVYPDDVPCDNPGEEQQRHSVTDHHHGEEVLGRQLAGGERPDSPT